MRILVKNAVEMLGKEKPNQSLNIFETPIVNFINMDHPVILLSREINWKGMEDELESYFSDRGRPSIPIRKIAGLLILKRVFNESDESVVDRWIENPYWQYFTGETYFQNGAPLDPSNFVHFRQRIGSEGFEIILKHSIQINDPDKQAGQDLVAIDTTVQEKNITFPTDAKLARKILERSRTIAKIEEYKLRRSYVRKEKEWRVLIRNSSHPKRKKNAKKAMKKLKNAAGAVLRELSRNLETDIYREELLFLTSVLNQKRGDSNKVYSLHEKEVHCISKGKAHKKYEFGTKCSVVWCLKTGLILSAIDGRNKYDGHLLEPSLNQCERVTGNTPIEALVDRGCRGKNKINNTNILIPNRSTKEMSRYQKDKIRKKMRKRAGIEPIIGHLKSDHRMFKCFLAGVIGDANNMLLAAIGFNFKKRLNHLFLFLFEALHRILLQASPIQLSYDRPIKMA